MNSLGLSILFNINKMNCFCSRESILINGTKYIIKEQISSTGGFSLIDLAENTITKKKYALKRITCHSIEDEIIAKREIEITGLVKHENLIYIIDSIIKGSADIVINTTSEVLMVLPYFKNGSLHDHLNLRSRNGDYMEETQVLQMFIGICEGLKALHEAKPDPIAHRDLKTANICLSDSMDPVIVDLGSATNARVQICGQQDAQKLQDLAEERCSIVYRAPELFSVESYCIIDERTDIWSLGCVLYSLCFWKSPFDAIYEKGDSVALAVLSGNIIISENSPYSQDIHDLIHFMCKLDCAERPFIYTVLERAQHIMTKLESRV